MINEINFLDCSPFQEGYFLFSLLKDLKEEGLTIVVALKMRDVDEIIFPMIESIGSIILVAEK